MECLQVPAEMRPNPFHALRKARRAMGRQINAPGCA